MFLLPVTAISFQGPLLEDNDNCALLEETEAGQRQTYTPCLSPLEHSQVFQRKSVTLQEVFNAKGQILFLFLQWKREQKEVLLPRANINTISFGSVPAKDLFWTEKQRFTTSPQGLRCRALQLYQWGLYAEIPQSALGNLCIIVHIRLLFFSICFNFKGVF